MTPKTLTIASLRRLLKTVPDDAEVWFLSSGGDEYPFAIDTPTLLNSHAPDGTNLVSLTLNPHATPEIDPRCLTAHEVRDYLRNRAAQTPVTDWSGDHRYTRIRLKKDGKVVIS